MRWRGFLALARRPTAENEVVLVRLCPDERAAGGGRRGRTKRGPTRDSAGPSASADNAAVAFASPTAAEVGGTMPPGQQPPRRARARTGPARLHGKRVAHWRARPHEATRARPARPLARVSAGACCGDGIARGGKMSARGRPARSPAEVSQQEDTPQSNPARSRTRIRPRRA